MYVIPAALMSDRFLTRESMRSAQRPSPFGPVNSQGTWYKRRSPQIVWVPLAFVGATCRKGSAHGGARIQGRRRQPPWIR